MPEAEAQQYIVKLDEFEGPMDLLLHLARVADVDILDIRIHLITAQFIEYMQMMKELNIELSADFLVMAATLMEMKVKRLLPRDETDTLPDEDEAESGEDPREELVRRLVEYRRFKDVALGLREMEESFRLSFSRDSDAVDAFRVEKEPEYEEVSVFDIITAFKNLLDRARTPRDMTVVRDRYTVPERMRMVLDMVRAAEDGLTFEALFEKEEPTKPEIIVTFLAILELIRRRRLSARQNSVFGEIRMFHRKES